MTKELKIALNALLLEVDESIVADIRKKVVASEKQCIDNFVEYIREPFIYLSTIDDFGDMTEEFKNNIS
jgi:hypothetical protein